MIVSVENLLDFNCCNNLISIYKDNSDKSKLWGTSFPLNVFQIPFRKQQNYIFEVKNFIKNFAVNFYKENLIEEHIDIVKWPNDSYQNYHLDTARNTTVLTSISYLNDDFQGGETIINTEEKAVKIVPTKGKTVFFDGLKYLHCVNKVFGERYVLAIWYKSLNLKNIDFKAT